MSDALCHHSGTFMDVPKQNLVKSGIGNHSGFHEKLEALFGREYNI